MKVEIFTSQLFNSPGISGDTEEHRINKARRLKEGVNNFLVEHPGASVQWLQTSAACKYGSFTQLTAIISYDDRPAQDTSPTT